MAENEFDLIVIGAGPGGYVAAIRAAQLGLRVACIEKEKPLGGTCLRIGCIPSKALLESSELFAEAGGGFAEHGIKIGALALDLPQMQKRKEEIVATLTRGIAGLFKKNKVKRFEGAGRIVAPGQVSVAAADGEIALAAPHIIIATGSISAPLAGVEIDGDVIGTSTEALTYDAPPEHLVVIGAGAIGLELGSVWRRLGSRVTVLEYLDRILPGMDTEIARDALEIFKRQGLEFVLGARVTGAKKAKAKKGAKSAANGAGAIVEIEGRDAISCSRVLLAVGRAPMIAGLGLEGLGVTCDRRGRVLVDEHYRTNIAGIYAIGDVIPGPMLAHKAEEEGIACVEGIVTGYGHVNYDAIPAVVYTHPEVASVGKSAEELTAAGIAFRAGVFPFLANGRARALGHTVGKVKILADSTTDRILGVHIVGARAGDLIAEAAAAIEFGATSEDLARTSHAHPSLAEIIKEAALAVDGRAIHI